ncbi:hypothetical protein AM493_08160 [Flavobacterium akiainvivens]|uniref:Outer membrane protein beta-barrel domain-containing protein n=1 Tax=Flavobacterium akiainvivens TaxID=1202724 RepID=A0A0M9VHX4_9FLAO|nr:outer membrane beta-barrel protein [Flavobacterium akiainvivens]KOS06012.1 hypothetical protein AM493_08160 [Flavobacterium akiainvivens]SFQ54217.1 outer membrane protein [Flavobacterium akiainvivens]
MKKLLFSLSTLLCITVAFAQETEPASGFLKGDAFISGTVGFGTQKTGDYKANQFTVAPKAGYFVSENIALGVGLGYRSQKSDQTDSFLGTTYETKTSTFEAGVFGRYYFTPASNFSIFTELSAAYATTKQESNMDWATDFTVNAFDVEFAPGFNYFVTRHLALEATFGFINYSTRKLDIDGAETTNAFNVSLDLANINFGIIYKF